MKVLNEKDVLENFKAVVFAVSENKEPITISCLAGQSVVLISLEEFNSLQETAYLLDSSNNAKRLLQAIGSFREVASQC